MIPKKRTRTSAPGTTKRPKQRKPKDLLTPLSQIGGSKNDELFRHTSLYQTGTGNLGGKSTYSPIPDGENFISAEDKLLADTVEYQTWRHFLQDEPCTVEGPLELTEKSNRKKKRRAKKVVLSGMFSTHAKG